MRPVFPLTKKKLCFICGIVAVCLFLLTFGLAGSPVATRAAGRQLCIAIIASALSTPVPDFNVIRTQQPAVPSADQLVYADALASGWGDWSWNITDNLSNPSPAHGGSYSISVHFTQGWDGLKLGRFSVLDLSSNDILRFWLNGGSGGGQHIQVQVNDGALTQDIVAPAGQWTKFDISLSSLGSPLQVSALTWWNNSASSQSTFYLDDIIFTSSGMPPTPPPVGQGPALSVDAAASQRPISPLVYGMSFAPEDLASELRLPLNRWGGNSVTRFNWQIDVSNHASDWYFENLPNDNPDPSHLPDGSNSDLFIDQNLRTGTLTLLTVPLIGWTPKSRDITCGFSVAKYGSQQGNDSQWRPDCGNGVKPDGSDVTGNDPLDTSTAITPSFVQAWMQHLIGKYGNATQGGLRYYNLDNEPMLWDSTHRDVHPTPTSYDELRDRTYQYAAAIKATDPGVLTLGPVVWGWTAYFWSAKDWASGGSWWDNPQDRQAHGNTPFIEWYLQQMQVYQQAHGVRLLDYLDVHNYPQAANVALSPAGSAQVQALRLRSTRSLWDPNYTDESWIGEAVNLIPRMHAWVDQDYPGTKLALSEYNWGALDNINGALAQADVLGIFGREGLDLAALWGPPSSGQPGAFAFRIYLNYDGAHGHFGDISVRATSADPDKLAVFAARRTSDGALTLVVINKNPVNALTSSLSLAHFDPASTAAIYRYSKASLNAIVRQQDQPVGQGGFTATYPPYSITLMVLTPSTMPPASQENIYIPMVVR